MRTHVLTGLVTASAVCGIAAHPAGGAVIFLSGDTNVTHALVGSVGVDIDPGNQQFFVNVLQGGTVVVVLETSHDGSVEVADTDLVTFYDERAGVTATLIEGPVTAADLAEADLFLVPLPDTAFTGAELSAMSDFLDAGGSIFLSGENGSFPTENSYVNDALAALGSNMEIINTTFDAGFTIATGDQIAEDPFTAGVETFTYAAPSEVALTRGGTILFFGTEGEPFLAYEETAFEDCNNNSIPDDVDIAEGISQDCNDNGVPDECDIADETSDDCNEDGVPDECQDCDENGTADECEIDADPSLDLNGNGILDECEGQANFNPPQQWGAAGEPSIEAVGDLDGDEDTDVVTAIPDLNVIQVFLNQGNDAQDDWQGLVANDPIPVGNDPSSVAVGSFNSNDDSDLDVAVANRADGTVSILLNDGTGDGALTLVADIPVGDTPSSVAVDDYNSDFLADLGVTLEQPETFVILFGDGDGRFSLPPLAGGPQLGFTPVVLFADDFDNNKCPDLTGGGSDESAEGGPPVGRIFVGLGQGDGTFDIEIYTVGLFPTDVCTGDLNGDGNTDIVASNSGDDTVSILINAGDGTFLTPITIPVGILPVSVECADLSSDGVPDLAVAVEDESVGPAVQVLQNVPSLGGPAGGVQFDPPIAFPLPAEPTFVVAAELNMDGNNDLVLTTLADGASGSVTTLLGDPDPISLPLGLDIKPGGCPNPLNPSSHGVLPVGLLGTADFDITQVDVSTVTISRADGVGIGVPPNEGPPGPHSTFSDVATPIDDDDECACHDLEGDGITDLSMKFRTDDVVAGLQLDDLNSGAVIELVVSGFLHDGRPFAASDCVLLVGNAPPGGLVVTAEAPVYIEVDPPDILGDAGGFPAFDRLYVQDTIVTLTTPVYSQGWIFIGWDLGAHGFLAGGGNTLLLRDPVIDVLVSDEVKRVEAVFVPLLPAPPGPAPGRDQE